MMEFGICTFAETTTDSRTGQKVAAGQRLRDLIEEIELADRVGLDVFGVGEHHRPDFAASSPAVILGGAATRTNRIKLTSAVTVLSSDDPVRVYQQFATVDLLSNGRAEIMAGRGSFIDRSRCSDRASTTTTICSRRISSCCCACARPNASRGRPADTVPR